jgi:hypothetical protein
MTLLATSAAGLQAQLELMQQYCQQWGLTVIIAKTKVERVSSGGSSATEKAALQTAERAGLAFAGQLLQASWQL